MNVVSIKDKEGETYCRIIKQLEELNKIKGFRREYLMINSLEELDKEYKVNVSYIDYCLGGEISDRCYFTINKNNINK